ncbi:MAG: Stk1 family PASTA domain-containing Ser/Thr kinase [Anaerovoracaceae bacterium]
MSKLLAGRYELIEKIGEGGMAVVYKGKDRLLNRYVAVKILRPEFTKDAQFIENFKRESQAAAGLQHPNIVSVYDVGKEGNIHFIVMELIDGRPLSDIISERAPLDYKQAIEITRQVASALSLAHRNNIIHRDVKPHNIMITRDGIAKLADFGIAKAVSDSTLVTETSRVIGSVHYFSPEQARGSYVDERSDIYSLGIVLYEMLTGQVPFDGDNPVQVALMHINDDIVPPSKLVPGIPPALEKLVMKATDKFQSNRYKNADELLEDLQNIEFVTKMVGDSVFAASDVEEFQEMNRKKHSEVDFVEEKPKKKKKKKGNGKKKIVIAAIAGVIAVIAVVIGILYAFGVIGGGIEVPNLVGMTTEEAEAELNELGLKMEVGEEVPSDEIEEGLIASQTPDEGETVEEGDTVTVMLSSGKPTGQVPSLVGRPYDEDSIRALLEASNYQLGSVTYQESDAEEGEIINQDPGAGTEAEEGTSVNVVVSKGTDKRTVPTLVGLSVDEAKQAIVDAGFTVGSISYAESTVYKQNIVMEQQYDAGEKLEEGTKINIVVSKGEPEVVTPPEETDPGTGEGGGDTETGGDEEGSTS